MLSRSSYPGVEMALRGMLHTVYTERGPHGTISLPDLLQELELMWPTITIGEFHDRLRMLLLDDLVELVPWTREIAAIPDRCNAMYFNGEVMFWAHLTTEQFNALNRPATPWKKGGA